MKSITAFAASGRARRSAMTPNRCLAFRSFATSVLALCCLGTGLAVAAPGDVELVSVGLDGMAAGGSPGGNSSLSNDGRYVLFSSSAGNIVSGDSGLYHDVFVFDRESRLTERVSMGLNGAEADGDSYDPTISGDGRYVSFLSTASNLVVGSAGGYGIYVFDRQTRATELVSPDGYYASISADGRYVVFSSWAADLVPNDTNRQGDIFLRDLQSNTTERVSVGPGSAELRYTSDYPSVSADGRFVSFCIITAGYLEQGDLWVRDRLNDTLELISVAANGDPGEWISEISSINADGRFVAFQSPANNLTSDDRLSANDIFVRDRLLGVTERVSRSPRIGGNSVGPLISSDGRLVTFQSDAPDLVPGDTNDARDVFIYDRRTGLMQRVDARSAEGDSRSGLSSLEPDGRYLVLGTDARLTDEDPVAGTPDVYLMELASPPLGNFSYTLAPGALEFGMMTLFTRRTLSFVLRNDGDVPLALNSVEIVGADESLFQPMHACGTSLAVGKACRIDVTFHPTSVGPKSARLRVMAGGDIVRWRKLSGTGVPAEFTVTPASLWFGKVSVGATSSAQMITIRNTGVGVLPIAPMKLVNPSQFSSVEACPWNLVVGGSCTVRVYFTPTTTGVKGGKLIIAARGGYASSTVSLAGRGVR